MDINPNTGKGWTDVQEQATFAEIMRIGRMERIKAIQLFRRCKSDHAKAVKLLPVTTTVYRICRSKRKSGARRLGLVDWLRHVRNSRRIGQFNC